MEQYVKKPAAVQVFALNGATDIILRKDIASEKITDEEGNKQTVWNCDERQIRVASAVTEEEVAADFDSWWDYQPPREAEPVTASDRLDALEGKNGGFAVNHVSASTLQGVLFSLHKNEVHSMGKSIFDGRVQIKYSYGCYGMTRGGGKTWHGGMDIVGVDSDIILMPYYEMPDGTQKPIKGRVTRARIVTDHSDRTWEWGYYVCVQLDADQTPDAVNFMYFCHCSRLLVDVGDRVISGQQLAIMGETGNAEGTHPHCHFEVRATASGKGLDPTAYAAIPNKAGIYGAAPAADKPAEIPANSEKAATSLLQNITVGPVSSGDAAAVVAVCKEHGTTADSYTNAENHLQIICIRSVVQAVADAVLAVCKERKLTDAKLYTSHWA